MSKGKIHIGTSGWHYEHWIGTYYPEKIKGKEKIEYYQKDFQTVEINNTFYEIPEDKTFKDWKNAVPEDFVFAVKASRYITHMKKLIVDHESLDRFFSGIENLEKKVGAILFQLPPKWNVNRDRLEKFIQELPKNRRYAFEFRDHSWYDDSVYQLLEENNCSFCIYDLAGHQSPIKVTADFVYIRLHGPGDKYKGKYYKPTLEKWADRCRDWQQDRKDVFLYFDNDEDGNAAFNAKELIEILEN